MTPTFQHASTVAPAEVYIIAEIGVNHDGQTQRAADLIDAAARAGANAVKFQSFTPARLLSLDAMLAAYQSHDDATADPAAQRWNTADELLGPLALSIDQLGALAERAHALGLHCVVTPFTPADAADLASLTIDAVKIASPDAVHTPLLDAAAALGLPMLISTGTCDLDELADAAMFSLQTRGALLHCVSSYPTPQTLAALGGIHALRLAFPDLPIGYSDHTPDTDTAALAVAAGACILEKHLTHNRRAPGPDHAASLEPDAFARYVAAARHAAHALGPCVKRCSPAERDVRTVSRQSVTTTRDLPASHTLTGNDLTTKRPGTGIPAAQLTRVLGQTTTRPLQANRVLMPSDIKRV